MSSRIALAVARPARGAFVIGRSNVFSRGFQLSTTRPSGLKESNPQDADNEAHKQDSLSKQKSGQGQWKPELASDSEEAVKADRDATTDTAKLQEETKKAAEAQKGKGEGVKDKVNMR